MLSFDTIVRYHRKNNDDDCLLLVSKRPYAKKRFYVIYPNEHYSREFMPPSSFKWTDIVKKLEGLSLGVCYNNGKPIVIDQLMIDLELQGHLKIN